MAAEAETVEVEAGPVVKLGRAEDDPLVPD